jgi:3-phenylpropionate/trans-cinnamate dioxygenase ferredoxin reductase subunit
VASLERIVIVGASLAGGRAAETLRAEGYDGQIVLIGAEDERPYERPPLSKKVLADATDEGKIFLRPSDYYQEQSIDLRLGVRAIGLDPAARRVRLDGGREEPYDRLLIATGARPRTLHVPGVELPGVYYLRTLADARAIRDASDKAQRVVVVGAGFIGAEVAATSRMRGLEVTLLEVLPVPLQRGLGDAVGGIYADIHREHGVDLRLQTGISRFLGAEKVEAVETTAGETIPCDLAVVGVGVQPETDWLAESGVAIHNGVVVDEFTQTTVPEVFAAGDVANWRHPTLGERLRVEHYENAQNQGVAAAKAMLGRAEPYAPVLYFWSDQYDLNLQYVGHAHGGDEVIFRGDIASRKFLAFYLRHGKLRAALGINRHRDVSAVRRLIRDGVEVTASQLADEQVDLRRLSGRA